LVIVEADRPLALPRNCPSAGPKSFDESPCRYSSGSTCSICGVLRAHGGRIADENRCRSPVSGSTRLSLIRGATTSTAPAQVVTSRGSWQPLRTTSRRPFSSRTSANCAQYASTSACNASASIRRAPARTISSITDDEPDIKTGTPEPSQTAASGTTLSMGRTFLADAPTPALLGTFN
jgi:hypothetical protein